MRKLSSNITDQELCELFREAGDNYQPEYSLGEKEEQWKKLSRKLYKKPAPLVRFERTGAISWRSGVVLTILMASFLILTGPDVPSGGSGKNRRNMNKKTLTKNSETFKPGHRPTLRELPKVPIDHRDDMEDMGYVRIKGGIVKAAGQTIRTFTMPAAPAPISAQENPGVGQLDTFQKKPPLVHSSKWSIGVAAGMEWSMVKGKTDDRTGSGVGVLVQYHLARRWSIEGGVLVANKAYAARPRDYHSPLSYPGLSNVNAHCRVFDIPLNVRYDLLQRPQAQAFISTGLSSFWMQKEEYAYKFNVNGSTRSSERTIYNQDRHFLSIVNISLGYEHAWNNISLQASPYLKLPLTGIGYGKVALVSTGIQFSVKYRF